MKKQCITWVDARSDDGWTSEEDLDHRLAVITTLGHLVRETSDVLCVASSRDERTGQLSGIMYIPVVCVVDRWDVVRPENNNGQPVE